MMTRRYYARYAGKDDTFTELYEVVDSHTHSVVAGPLYYHVAIDKAEAMSGATDHSALVHAAVWELQDYWGVIEAYATVEARINASLGKTSDGGP